MLHDLAEANIAGGLGNQQMKAPIRFDATVVVVEQPLIVIQRLAHLQHLRLRAPLRRQRRRLGFQTQTQFENAAHTERRVDIEA
ncbi:hypothetical protein D3C78_1535270 [compost metagenome]